MEDLFSRLDAMAAVTIAVACSFLIIVFIRLSASRHGAPSAADVTLRGDGSYDYTVANSEEFQHALVRRLGWGRSSAHQECDAVLVPSDNGATILVLLDEACVGSIAEQEVVKFNAALRGRRAQCNALLTRDTTSGQVRIRLDLLWPPSVNGEPR